MDLLDIIDGINNGSTKPSYHDCKEALEVITEVSDKLVQFHGFEFKYVGNILEGNSRTGEVILSNSFGTVIRLEGDDYFCIVKPTSEHGLIIKEAVLNCSIIGVAAIDNSYIAGNVEVYDNSIHIAGEVVIKGSLYTHTRDLAIIRVGDDDAKLTFVSNGSEECVTQPIIGPETHDNMSYGRWSPASANMCLDVINIDNVDVTIQRAYPFSIGSYGYGYVPIVNLINSGSIDCPEGKGYRHLIYRPVAPEGSTKIEGYCRYVLSATKDGSDIELTDEAKELVEEIRKIRPDIAEKITAFNPVRNLRSIVRLLELKPDIDVSLLLDKKSMYNIASAECCHILEIPVEKYCVTEILWMEAKCKHLLSRAGYTESEIEAMRGFSIPLAQYARELFPVKFESLTPYQVRYIYEMIPEYEFYFTGKSKEECAKEFLNIGLEDLAGIAESISDE